MIAVEVDTVRPVVHSLSVAIKSRYVSLPKKVPLAKTAAIREATSGRAVRILISTTEVVLLLIRF